VGSRVSRQSNAKKHAAPRGARAGMGGPRDAPRAARFSRCVRSDREDLDAKEARWGPRPRGEHNKGRTSAAQSMYGKHQPDSERGGRDFAGGGVWTMDSSKKKALCGEKCAIDAATANGAPAKSDVCPGRG